MNRGTRTVNVTLLVLLVTVAATGVLAFATGSPGPAGWVVAVHGGSGLGLMLLVPAKAAIARRGLRRPGRSRKVISLAFAALVVASVATGLLHAVGGWRPVLGLLPMQLHVGSAVGAVVLLVGHLVMHRRRRPRLRRTDLGRTDLGRTDLGRTDLDRRRALLGAGVVAGSAVLWAVAPGRERRETGSHPITAAAAVPVTQWMFDPVPRVPDLRPVTAAGPLELAALPQRTVRAVLDCTGGWYTEQEWRGVGLDALGLPAGRSVEVVSVTGYRRRFPAEEAGSLLLATHLAGRPLRAGHGGPVRLVAPGRRGFWWVKWVARIDVLDEPWWWQPPFPLQ